MKLWFILLLWFSSFCLLAYSENSDYESKLRAFLGEGAKLYNIYIRPYNKKVTILSRQVNTDGYKYFGLGLEYENPNPKLKIFKYTYFGKYRLDQISDSFDIPPDTIFFLIPNCQILILTQNTEKGRQVVLLDSELQQLELPKLEEDVAINLNEYLENLAYAKEIRLKRNTLVFKTADSLLEYSIPVQRILEPTKYEITPTGFCKKK